MDRIFLRQTLINYPCGDYISCEMAGTVSTGERQNFVVGYCYQQTWEKLWAVRTVTAPNSLLFNPQFEPLFLNVISTCGCGNPCEICYC